MVTNRARHGHSKARQGGQTFSVTLAFPGRYLRLSICGDKQGRVGAGQGGHTFLVTLAFPGRYLLAAPHELFRAMAVIVLSYI